MLYRSVTEAKTVLAVAGWCIVFFLLKYKGRVEKWNPMTYRQ